MKIWKPHGVSRSYTKKESFGSLMEFLGVTPKTL